MKTVAKKTARATKKPTAPSLDTPISYTPAELAPYAKVRTLADIGITSNRAMGLYVLAAGGDDEPSAFVLEKAVLEGHARVLHESFALLVVIALDTTVTDECGDGNVYAIGWVAGEGKLLVPTVRMIGYMTNAGAFVDVADWADGRACSFGVQSFGVAS